MTQPRVFILEPCERLDVSGASAYGELIELFEPGERRMSTWDREYPTEIIRRLVAHGFEPQRDRVLVAGPIVNLVRATTAIVAAWPDRAIAALYWCGATRKYVERYLGASADHIAEAKFEVAPGSVIVTRQGA